MHTQLKALVLLFILILGVTVSERAETIAAFLDSKQHTANIFNPVAAFLGISNEEETTTTSYDSLQTNDTVGRTEITTVTEGSSIFGGTPTPATGISTGVSGAQDTNTTRGAIRGLSPTFSCLPTVVAENEEALVMWACRDGAYTSVGTNIETNGDTYGAVRVSPSQDTTYEIDCLNEIDDVDDTRSSCDIKVAHPALALVADKSSVGRGGTVTLSWDTKDVSACSVTSDAHSLFKRNGIEGEARSPAIVRETTFTLRCETISGVIEKREVTVGL